MLPGQVFPARATSVAQLPDVRRSCAGGPSRARFARPEALYDLRTVALPAVNERFYRARGGLGTVGRARERANNTRKMKMGSEELNEDRLNLAIRKFLKVVGVTSQREIEQAIREAVAEGRLDPGGDVEARVTVELPGLDLTHVVDDRLELG